MYYNIKNKKHYVFNIIQYKKKLYQKKAIEFLG